MKKEVKRGMGKIENASQAREILALIPKDKWVVGILGFDNGSSCAIGHINRFCNTHKVKKGILPFLNKKENDYSYYKGASSISDEWNFTKLVQKFFKETKMREGVSPAYINDSPCHGYHEDHPKDRIMHMLDDMIKAGY